MNLEMNSSVSVLSKVPNLLKYLRSFLPNVTFHEVRLPEDAEKIGNSEIVIADIDLLGPLVNNLKHVKWVQSTWAGLDSIKPYVDTKSPQFTLTRFSGNFFAHVMSQYVLAQMINFERGFFNYHDSQKLQEWDESLPEFRNIADLTVGIMGLGNIGYGIGKDLNYLGAKVYGYGRSERKELGYLQGYYTKPQLQNFLKELDYVINVMPSTKETEGLLNSELLENCSGKQAVFINVGRGNIIDETELIRALEQKWLRGAILDVFVKEPLPENSKLWKMPQVHITPHISGPTIAKEVVKVFEDNYKLYNEGKPLNFVVEWNRG